MIKFKCIKHLRSSITIPLRERNKPTLLTGTYIGVHSLTPLYSTQLPRTSTIFDTARSVGSTPTTNGASVVTTTDTHLAVAALCSTLCSRRCRAPLPYIIPAFSCSLHTGTSVNEVISVIIR